MWRTIRRGLSKCSTGPTSSLVVDTKSVSVDQWMSLRLLFGNTSPYPEKLAARVETSIHLYKVELPTGELRLNLPRAPIQHGCLLQRPYLRHFRRCLGRESSTSIPCILPVSYIYESSGEPSGLVSLRLGSPLKFIGSYSLAQRPCVFRLEIPQLLLLQNNQTDQSRA